MSEELTIQQDTPDEASDTHVLRVNRSVSTGNPVYAANADEARGNKLAAALLEMGTLEAVLLQDQAVTLLKSVSGTPWAEVIPAANTIIESHFQGLEETSGSFKQDMSTEEKELAYRAQETLNTEINPMVASHGGFIEVLAVKAHTLFIHMGGGCQGCGMATATVKQGVEGVIFRTFPELTEVLDTTDHAAGTNPYFAP